MHVRRIPFIQASSLIVLMSGEKKQNKKQNKMDEGGKGELDERNEI